MSKVGGDKLEKIQGVQRKTNIESLITDITELGWYVRISKPDETKPKDNMQKRWKLAAYPLGEKKRKGDFVLGCFVDSLFGGLHSLLRFAEQYPTQDDVKMEDFRRNRDRIIGMDSVEDSEAAPSGK